ncbi:unnamed protein product [Rotaria sp. Silwood2]|nr:unnamed protein product [Rotaria sp. Silwood2]
MTNCSFFFHFKALTGYQPTSEFSIFNRNGELLFNVKEDSTCCQRCWCTNSREFTLHIRDTADNEVIRMSRALKCCCVCCWCGDCESCKQEIIVESPPGTIIGSANHEGSRCRMRYTLRDANRTNTLGIIGPRCICDGDFSCCCESEFADIQKKRPINWREGHNALVRTIREARQITRAMETGAPLPKQTPPQIPSDYVQCEFCQRHFNKHSAERHIPFCETQYKRKQMQYAAANNARTAGGSIGRQGRAHQQQYNLDSPTGSANKQHQINSAPSTIISRRPQKTNDEKDYRRPPLNPNTFKKTNFGETATNNRNGTPPKYGSNRTTKTRSATGAYLPGMMRTGRNIENDDLNILAGTGRGQQKSDASPQLQRRTSGLRTRSPSPARRPSQANEFLQQQQHQQQQQQNSRAPTAAKHCHECGKAFPVEWAKFCCECGEKRLGL